nr:immunoglobulin light chain junction region [Macaca mulatta]MOX28103.1 immunoglobulin light chain junction region [Macaca mulatta]MOX28342.1 immunoglobulin light chain junction region [Macaca mulatta]MOX28377.1 immunoglobulin light chain junction region [Macaca mulatta]MOX28900.1 immunoglobulin light chain junction region [Macaca mulatta]
DYYCQVYDSSTNLLF